MTKDQITTKIQTLKTEDEALITRRNEIRKQYSRPTEWIADEDYKAIARSRQAIAGEIADLNRLLDRQADQEWADRQAENYPDGQV